MKPQYEIAKEKVETQAEQLQHAMQLDWIHIRHTFVEMYNEEDHHTLADTETYWQYLDAKITWYLPALVRLDDAELENTLIHELTHVLLAPIEDKVPDKYNEMCEFTVELITKALKGMRDAN